jgi:hypothetical protein
MMLPVLGGISGSSSAIWMFGGDDGGGFMLLISWLLGVVAECLLENMP